MKVTNTRTGEVSELPLMDITTVSGILNTTATDLTIELTVEEKRELAQTKITKAVDPDNRKRSTVTMSLLGTAADAAASATILNATFIAVLASLADTDPLKAGVKASINQLYNRQTGFDDLVVDCKTYLTKIETGEYKIPFLVKYGSISGVFQDVGERNTLIAEALVNKS